MIRDLRYEEIERADRRKRRVRLMLLIVVVSAVSTLVVSREMDLRRQWAELPVADESDLDSLRARRAAIEQMLDQNHFWAGAFTASRELDELVLVIHNEERLITRAADKIERDKRRVMEEAESARLRGLAHAERGEYDQALSQFRRSLELTEPTWEHGEQVRIDIQALESWKAKNE